MIALIGAREFKRIVDNTKKFTTAMSSNQLMGWIRLRVEVE